MTKLKNRFMKAGATLAVVAAAVLGAPQMAQAATSVGPVYSSDSGAKYTGSITWNSPWYYTANWTTQDLKNDGRTPYIQVTALTWNTSGGGSTIKKSQTFSSQYALAYYTTFYNSGGGAKLATVQVKICNGGPNVWCKYTLYDNPYS